MKTIRTALMLAAMGAFSIGAVGCGKKDEKKEEPAPAQKVTEEDKAETPAETPKAEETAAEGTEAEAKGAEGEAAEGEETE